MLKSFIFGLILLWATSAGAENFLINGSQTSRIQYQLEQRIIPADGIRTIMLNYVVPESFQSPTYNQTIQGFKVDFSLRPNQHKDRIDRHGNKIREAVWQAPSQAITTTISFTAINRVSLKQIKTQTAFPVKGLPGNVKPFLAASQLVDTKDRAIQAQAHKLTASARSEFDAVQHILTWVVDHMHYVLTPVRFDATYSFQSGKGNCQNYSHLAAALMRAAGIPVRIVNGITLKEPYDIKINDRILTVKMAQGRHAWIEVFFPDLGWVPFDPSGTEFFVSNRFIRIELGMDNHEMGQDGLMRWVQLEQAPGRPKLEEDLSSRFVSDRVSLSAQKTDYGPRKLLLCPPVDAPFTRISTAPAAALPVTISPKKLHKLRYVKPFLTGNLEFPARHDFLNAYGPAVKSADGSLSQRKNFVVETAEYVTTKGQQYAQTFILKKPLQMNLIGLALHKFNHEGQLWVEIYNDKDGEPGAYISTSDMLDLNDLKFTPGYAWVDFSFQGPPSILSPGRYWIALGFTGGPIVNWFFSYGKPVGPQDGTRYRTIFDETWSRSLAYEFVYRVMGLTTE